jgi:hypothetical protein
MSTSLPRFLAALTIAALAPLAPLASADVDYGFGPTTYYLHRGSTYQQGCWGPCDCLITDRAPMLGSFVLTLANVGDVTDQYTFTNINWHVPTLATQPFGAAITGSGHFLTGQHPYATHQYLTLDLTITPPPFALPNPQIFEADFSDRTRPPPIIAIDVANSTTGCPGVRLQILATPFRADWNADARISVQDLFDFLADYFTHRADYTGDGLTNVGDLFALLADYFAGL